MKKIFFIITLSLFLGLIFLPNIVKADEADECPEGMEGLACRIDKITTFVKTDIVPAVGGVALVIAGILFMFSGASPQLHNQAKQALIYIVIGIIVILGASELVSAIVGG